MSEPHRKGMSTASMSAGTGHLGGLAAGHPGSQDARWARGTALCQQPGDAQMILESG